MAMFDCSHCGDRHHVNDFCATGPMSSDPMLPASWGGADGHDTSILNPSITAPMTPKLDEARLREFAEAVVASRAALENAKAFNLGELSRADHDTCEKLDEAIQPVEDTILALLDALSAERERGDRAVGLSFDDKLSIERVKGWLNRHPIDRDAGVPIHPDDVRAVLNIAIATQKAEGAET